MDIESEIDIQVKEATDLMRQRFVESTREQLYSIKQQHDLEIAQIHENTEIVRKKALLDMAYRAKQLHGHTLKKFIRDGTIYNIIHDQEEEDHTTYPDNISKNWFVNIFDLIWLLYMYKIISVEQWFIFF